jgi:tetratricopeptide (TPR) repeat protein
VDRVAIALLARMACMAPGEPVPRDLLARTLEDVEPRLRADGLRRLGAVGLLEEGVGWLRLHRLLVCFVRKERLDQEAQPAVDRVLIYLGRDALDGHLTGTALAAVIPHLAHVAATAAAMPYEGEVRSSRLSDTLHAAQLLRAAGLALNAAAELCGAKQRFEQVLEIHEQLLGPDHPETAMSLWDLAWVMRDQAQLVAARQLFQRALQIQEQVLGPDHPDTTIGLTGLALVLQDCGEADAALVLFERALHTRQRVLGPEHQRTAVSLFYQAQLLHAQADRTHARAIYEHALAIRQRVLGPDHPDTAKSLAGLALLLQDQGESAAARSLHERALDIRERVLGVNHHHTAWSLGHLANLLRDQGDPTAARPLFERALAIRERVLGPEHPDTVATRRDLEELAAEADGAGVEG